MSRLHNPFLIYGYESPEYFCDRKEETATLISALCNGRNVTLMAPRRIGKTGLIMNAFHTLRINQPEAICFYMDIFATSNMHDFVQTFGNTVLGQLDSASEKALSTLRSFLSNCRMVLSNDILQGTKLTLEFRPEESESTLKGIFAYLKQSERECFIAIDEFQQVAEYNDGSNVEALLRSYIQFCPNLHFIFSGSKNHLLSNIFDNPKRPFYRSTEKMYLDILDETVYYDFANSWMERAGIVISQEIFHHIYSLFCGHTWYIQYVLNKIYEASPIEVDEHIVNKCIAGIVRSNTEDYQRLYNMLTRNQQQLLVAIARQHNVAAINSGEFLQACGMKGSSSINKALASLINQEFVYHYHEGYQVYDRFLTFWLQTL